MIKRFPHTFRVLSTLAFGCVVFAALNLPLWILKAMLAAAVLSVLALAIYADTRPKT